MQTNRRQAIGLGLVGATLAVSRGAAAAATGKHAPAIAEPRVCGLVDPLALGDLPPRFSWQLADATPGARQIAWRVVVAPTAADLAASRNLLWDSGRVESAASLDII